MYPSTYSVGHFATTPTPSRSSLPIPKLSNKEKGLYSNLFTRADPEGTNKVEGRAAVEFFKKSGLPVDTLKEIWNLSSPNNESYLDRERFYIAMRLIALAQQGKPVSLDAITSNIEVDLPVFSGSSERSEADPFEISAEERTKYESIFNTTAGGKGNLTGFEARGLFERTGVDIAELSRIWTLADPQDTGILTKNQFLVAMHLISKVKHRIRIPDILPASLSSILNSPSQSKPDLYKEFGSLPSPVLPPPQPKPDPPRKMDSFDSFPDVSPMPVISFPKPLAPDKRIYDERSVSVSSNRPGVRPGLIDPPSEPLKPLVIAPVVDLIGGKNDDPFAEIPRPEIKPPVDSSRREQPQVGDIRREQIGDGRREGREGFSGREFGTEARREGISGRDFGTEGRRDGMFGQQVRVEDGGREGVGKGFGQVSREERRQVDDSIILSLQKSLKTLELQLEELTEELRSTKKEVRLTREDAGQQLEDFSKEMRKQRDSMEQQITDLAKELKTERRSIVETVETVKSVGKSMGESLNALGTMRMQCEDALKQQQFLSTQMQTSLQQSSAQQGKFLAQVAEMLERQKGDIAGIVRMRPEPEPVRSFPTERYTPVKSEPQKSDPKPMENIPRIEEKPSNPMGKMSEKSGFEPDFSMSFQPPRAAPLKEEVKEVKSVSRVEEVKEVPRKLGLDPPPSRIEEPKPPSKPSVSETRKPQTDSRIQIEEFDFDVEPKLIQSPPQKPDNVTKDPPVKPTEKPKSVLEDFDFPHLEHNSSFGVTKSNPQVEEFRFEASQKPGKDAEKPKFPAFEQPPAKPAAEPQPPKTDFSAYSFDFAIPMTTNEQPKVAVMSEKPKSPRVVSTGKREEVIPRKKSSNSSFDFDVGDDNPQPNSLPKPKISEKSVEDKPKKDDFDFSQAPKETKAFEFGDFKAFEGAFKPEFNADFQNGVFKFDPGAVQQSKTVPFEF